jgi:hypothetical protein
MIGRRASQRLWCVPQCQEAQQPERTISPQPAWGGALRAIRIVVPAASLNVLRTLAFTEAVAFASAETRCDTLVASLLRPCSRRRSSRAHPAKPPPRPRGLVQCFPSNSASTLRALPVSPGGLSGRCLETRARLTSDDIPAYPALCRNYRGQKLIE